MELQIKRWLEQFLQLAELPCDAVSTRMEFFQCPFHVYIECIDNTVFLSVGKEVEQAYQAQVLEKLLTVCHPMRTKGTLFRAWILKRHQMLSCTLNTSSTTSHWLDCLLIMKRLLNRYVEGRP